MSILEKLKSLFVSSNQELSCIDDSFHHDVIEQFKIRDNIRWKAFTDNTEFEGMSEKEVDELIPLDLKLNMVGNLCVPEVLSWYRHFLSNEVWPTTEEAYFMRYLKGDHKKIPFHILRKFIMEDSGESVDKEIKLWSHR